MKIFQFALVATVVAATVAFPTPQEVKSVSEPKEQDENLPMVQKIEIHVEVKALNSEMKIPAMVTVTEVKEHLKKSTEAVKTVDAEKAPEVVKSTDVKSSESVESVELVKPVEAAKSVEPMKYSVDAKETEAFKETPKVNDSTTKATVVEEEAPVKAEEAKPVIKSVTEEVDQLVGATSEPKAAIIEAPMVKSVEPEPEKVETKVEEAKPVQVEAKATETVEPQADDDSDEDNSSEEESTTQLVMAVTEEPVRASPVITFDEAVKESTAGSTKEQATTVMPEAEADEVTKVETDIKSVESKAEAKSVLVEKVIPIVEDLPKEKQSVEVEPVYKTIPVAIVHDEPIKEEVKEVTVRTVETVQAAEQKKEEIPAAKPTEATIAKADVEKPTVQTEVESTTPAGVEQKEDTPVVKTVDTFETTVADLITVTSSSIVTEEEKPEKPNVLVVEAVKAVDVKESKQTVQTTAEPTKETEVLDTEAVKEEGSSTKAATSESEAAEHKVEDSSVSSSTAIKLIEDEAKPSAVTEKAEAVTIEESTTTTTTTTTTAAPVKVEGKKGKKKLPANIRGYSKRLQQEQRKAH